MLPLKYIDIIYYYASTWKTRQGSLHTLRRNLCLLFFFFVSFLFSPPIPSLYAAGPSSDAIIVLFRVRRFFHIVLLRTFHLFLRLPSWLCLLFSFGRRRAYGARWAEGHRSSCWFKSVLSIDYSLPYISWKIALSRMNDDWVRACSRNVIIILDHNHARPCRVSSREQNELLHRHRNTSQNHQESFFFPTPAPTETLFFMFFFYAGKLRHICHDTCTKEQGRRVVSRGLAGEFRSNRAAPGLRQLTDPVATSNLHKKHSWIMSWFYSCTCRVVIFLSGKRLLILLHKFLLIIQTDGCINLDLPDHFTQSSSSFHFYIY